MVCLARPKTDRKFPAVCVAESKTLFCTSCHRWWRVILLMIDSPIQGRDYTYEKIHLFKSWPLKWSRSNYYFALNSENCLVMMRLSLYCTFKYTNIVFCALRTAPLHFCCFVAFSSFCEVICHDSSHVYLPVDHWKLHLLRIVCFGGECRNLHT